MARDLDKPPTRAELNRLLVGNALTKPMPNIVVPAAVAAGGLVLGLGVIAIVIAVVCWLALAAITYFDGDEAEQVAAEARAGRKREFDKAHPRVLPGALAPPIASRLQAVTVEQSRIGQAIERAELLSVSAASEAAGQQRLAADVRDLREQMGAVSAGMSEALSDAPET